MRRNYKRIYHTTPRYPDANVHFVSVELPSKLHPLLKDKDNLKWDIDSRIEVFETLLSRIENKVGGNRFINSLSKKYDRQVNYVVLINWGYNESEEDKEYKLFAEVHFEIPIIPQ